MPCLGPNKRAGKTGHSGYIRLFVICLAILSFYIRCWVSSSLSLTSQKFLRLLSSAGNNMLFKRNQYEHVLCLFLKPLFGHNVCCFISWLCLWFLGLALLVWGQLDRLLDIVVASPGRLMQHKEQVRELNAVCFIMLLLCLYRVKGKFSFCCWAYPCAEKYIPNVSLVVFVLTWS